MPHPPLPSSATTDALTLLLSRSSGISRHFTSRRSSTAHFKQQSALCTVGAGILGAKGAEGKRSDDSRARVVDALQAWRESSDRSPSALLAPRIQAPSEQLALCCLK